MLQNVKNFLTKYFIMSVVFGALIYFISFPLLFLSPGPFTSLVMGACLSSLWYGHAGVKLLLAQKKVRLVDLTNKDLHNLLFSVVSIVVLLLVWSSI